jgi:hypothetical protein
LSSQDAPVLAAELGLERRTHLTQTLTGLARGEAVGRFGHHRMVHVRVPPLPSIAPLAPEAFEALIAPITRLREDIEAELRPRHPVAPPASHPAPGTDALPEGQHEW